MVVAVVVVVQFNFYFDVAFVLFLFGEVVVWATSHDLRGLTAVVNDGIERLGK